MKNKVLNEIDVIIKVAEKWTGMMFVAGKLSEAQKDAVMDFAYWLNIFLQEKDEKNDKQKN